MPSPPPWAALQSQAWAARLGDSPDARAVLAYSLRSYAPNTLHSYGPYWLAFERYCVAAGRSALPAEPATVALYMASIMRRGTVRPTSIRPYRAVIDTVHRLVLGSPKVFPVATAPWFTRLIDIWRTRHVEAFTAVGRGHACPRADAAAASSFWFLPSDGTVPAEGLRHIHAQVHSQGGCFSIFRPWRASRCSLLPGRLGIGLTVPERHYIDRSVMPCDAARFFFAFRLAG